MHSIPCRGTEPTLLEIDSESRVVISLIYVGCCGKKLFTHQMLALGQGGVSAIEMLMGVWFDHDMMCIV